MSCRTTTIPTVLATVALVGLGGCGQTAPVTADSTGTPAPATTSPPVAPDVPADAVRVTSNDGGFEVAYRLMSDPAPLNEPFDLEVWVLDTAHGSTMPGTLAIDGRMPHHKHGMNVEPNVERRDDGSFLVEGMLFHMPGYWEIHFDLTSVGLTERAQTSMELD